jgi:hypothetical protein
VRIDVLPKPPKGEGRRGARRGEHLFFSPAFDTNALQLCGSDSSIVNGL